MPEVVRSMTMVFNMLDRCCSGVLGPRGWSELGRTPGGSAVGLFPRMTAVEAPRSIWIRF